MATSKSYPSTKDAIAFFTAQLSTLDSEHKSAVNLGHLADIRSGHVSAVNYGHVTAVDTKHASAVDPGHASAVDTKHASAVDTGNASAVDHKHGSAVDTGNASGRGYGPASAPEDLSCSFYSSSSMDSVCSHYSNELCRGFKPYYVKNLVDHHSNLEFGSGHITDSDDDDSVSDSDSEYDTGDVMKNNAIPGQGRPSSVGNIQFYENIC